MSLITIIKSLFQVRSLSVIACVGIALALMASNQRIKRAGAALSLIASGAAMATVVQYDNFEEAEQIRAAKHLAKLKQLQAQYGQRESSLKTFLDMSMAEAESLKKQISQMHEVLADDQLEKVSIFRELEAKSEEHQHVLYELNEMAIAQATASAQIERLQASARLEIDQLQTAAKTRIAELEAMLAEKTNIATQMLSELEAEATSTFNQFNAKVTAQSELIDKLRRQVEALRSENTALTNQQTRSHLDKQIGRIRSGHPIGSALFDQPTMRHQS